jgi:hypothetical protein
MPSSLSKVTALPVKRGFGETMRKDAWWVQPVAVGLGFLIFIVYSTWAAFQADFYHVGNLLSPFYSPELWYPAGSPSADPAEHPPLHAAVRVPAPLLPGE